MEQSLLADHEREFATPHCAWHGLLAAKTARSEELLLGTNLDASEARRHEPKAGADRGERPTQAVRLRTAGEQSQRFETRALKRELSAQTREFAQRRNATPAQPAVSATQSTR